MHIRFSMTRVYVSMKDGGQISNDDVQLNVNVLIKNYHKQAAHDRQTR